MIWIILSILTLGTLLYICAPLYSAAEAPLVGEDIEAYRAEAAQTAPEEAASFERQLLERAKPKPLKTGVPRAWLASVFVASCVLTGFMYHSIGRADLSTRDLPRVQPVAPGEAGAEAISQMSPQEQAAMITAMVDGLAARLRDDPQDAEGWVRLLRSRQVLGQDAAADIALMRETFVSEPEVIEDILQRSGRAPEP